MNYREIEDWLNSDDSEKVLEFFGETFKKLDEYSEYLTKSKSIEPQTIERLLMRVTGYWGLLDLAYKIVETYKEKKQGDFYCSRKIEIEKNNEKFNASATDKEASAHVNTERRIRNILESYKDRSDKIISSCQSYLKHISESYKRAGKQEG